MQWMIASGRRGAAVEEGDQNSLAAQAPIRCIKCTRGANGLGGSCWARRIEFGIESSELLWHGLAVWMQSNT